ncbi:MAG: hypothetical protein JOZ90_11040 [Alphaproteobacteria bacterium]|nr:hypothetical protein [Alphaproteobacteria bacterium]MBV9371006.1 hypothetical protein [Alphaproteobacteria bacterium]MBV9901621.1 hypothetical protein [Alphaproteobacteria bacterium]
MRDGTFVREIVYRIPEPIDFTFNMCAPDLLDVTGTSLDGGPVASRKLTPERRGCIKTRFMNISGIFALAMRTRAPDSDIEFEVAIIPPPPPPMTPPPMAPPPLPPPPP